MRTLPLVALIGLIGCHGIEHPTSPAPVPTRSNAAVRLNIVPSPGELPIGGGSALVRVEALGADGLGVATAVSLSVSGGELTVSQVTTDRTGHATASWQGTQTATVTATAGDVLTIAAIRVTDPVVLPPPSAPPAPKPPVPPDPQAPPPPPALTVSITATPSQVEVNHDSELQIAVSNLNAGESVIAYQWDWDGDGKTDETSAQPFRLHTFRTDGIVTTKVGIVTSGNRTASGAVRVVVFRP